MNRNKRHYRKAIQNYNYQGSCHKGKKKRQ